MKAMLLLVLLILLAGGCAHFSAVDSRYVVDHTYSVTPDRTWNRATIGSEERWTMHGIGLDSLLLYAGIKDQKPLLKIKIDNPPLFRSEMRATEVAELYVATLTRAGAGRVEYMNLRPISFGTLPGFRFDFRFYSEEGLEFKGLAQGAISAEGHLHFMTFSAPAVHYYAASLSHAEAVFDSVRMVKGS